MEEACRVLFAKKTLPIEISKKEIVDILEQKITDILSNVESDFLLVNLYYFTDALSKSKLRAFIGFGFKHELHSLLCNIISSLPSNGTLWLYKVQVISLIPVINHNGYIFTYKNDAPKVFEVE